MIGNRRTVRRAARNLTLRAWRPLNRASVRRLPGHRRGPDDFSQALTAFARAIRCQRRLARLAASFFDSGVVDREARQREQQQRWMDSWLPVFDKVYGTDPVSRPGPGVRPTYPRLPGPRTQRAVDRELVEWELWVTAGRLALSRHQQRRPHALLSLGQLTRLLWTASRLGRLACGFDTCQAAPPMPSDVPDFESMLARAYGPSSAS
jgi:hypothetical protein